MAMLKIWENVVNLQRIGFFSALKIGKKLKNYAMCN